MAHSLEARVPYLDPVVSELALALPTKLKVRRARQEAAAAQGRGATGAPRDHLRAQARLLDPGRGVAEGRARAVRAAPAGPAAHPRAGVLRAGICDGATRRSRRPQAGLQPAAVGADVLLAVGRAGRCALARAARRAEADWQPRPERSTPARRFAELGCPGAKEVDQRDRVSEGIGDDGAVPQRQRRPQLAVHLRQQDWLRRRAVRVEGGEPRQGGAIVREAEAQGHGVRQLELAAGAPRRRGCAGARVADTSRKSSLLDRARS